ncbi:MAG: hypothetical protein JNL73_08890 [Anaerolineales bacterium]|nr:hypothetical protein [Anaerolineales bacterium]
MDRRFRQRPFRTNRRSSPLIGALWMFGLAYLFFSHNWWPGILILIGITIVANAVLAGVTIATAAPEIPSSPPPEPSRAPGPVAAPTPFVSTADEPVRPPSPTRPLDLPDRCPNCGGPTGASAPQGGALDPTLCHYCGSRLAR